MHPALATGSWIRRIAATIAVHPVLSGLVPFVRSELEPYIAGNVWVDRLSDIGRMWAQPLLTVFVLLVIWRHSLDECDPISAGAAGAEYRAGCGADGVGDPGSGG